MKRYYLFNKDGTISGSSSLDQGEGWEQHEECPFEYGKMVKGEWVEIENPRKSEEEREASIQAEIRKIAEESLRRAK